MKKVMDRGWVIKLALVMVSIFCINTAEAQTRVSLQVFYDELQPYGTWMDYGTYGYVWIPRVERGFVPYSTNGYWINTEYGNTWVSDYAWGWAPFHYGRWLFDDFYGWIWVPDTQWGPAWVAWRSGGGYYGWAPLMPGMGIHASFHYYNHFPHHYWSFVPYRYITYRQVYNHCVPRPQVVKIINHTTIITHNHIDNRRHAYFTGPTRDDIERRGGGRVTVHQVNNQDRPGRTEVSRSTANFYRPEVDNSSGSRSRSVPSSFVRKDREGGLDRIEPVRDENDNIQRYRKSETDQDFFNELRSNRSQRKEETNLDQNVQRRSYQPSYENKNRTRTYERIPQENKQSVRDRYEAPPLERTRSGSVNENVRRSNTWQPGERHEPVRHENPNYGRNPSLNSSQLRSTNGQSQRSIQPSKHESGALDPATLKPSGHSVVRKRN